MQLVFSPCLAAVTFCGLLHVAVAQSTTTKWNGTAWLEDRKAKDLWIFPGSGFEFMDEENLQNSYAHLDKSTGGDGTCLEYDVSGICIRRIETTATWTTSKQKRRPNPAAYAAYVKQTTTLRPLRFRNPQDEDIDHATRSQSASQLILLAILGAWIVRGA